jgi:hypothetical protein
MRLTTAASNVVRIRSYVKISCSLIPCYRYQLGLMRLWEELLVPPYGLVVATILTARQVRGEVVARRERFESVTVVKESLQPDELLQCNGRKLYLNNLTFNSELKHTAPSLRQPMYSGQTPIGSRAARYFLVLVSYRTKAKSPSSMLTNLSPISSYCKLHVSVAAEAAQCFAYQVDDRLAVGMCPELVPAL